MKLMKKITKALVLLSGGLDSILAAEALKRQGVKVVGLSFKSYFFDARAAEKAAEDLKIPLRIVDFSEEHLAMLKNPKHGYGKAMNPCIDCHVLMLKKSREVMKKDGFDFVATGEVLGERPMSQTSRALKLIEKESSLSGFLLRPLSAKLLKITLPEQEGLIERSNFFDISGRSRKKQSALARAWHIHNYPSPAGGCLLTDKIFGQKLRELLAVCQECGEKDVVLLKYGRHFWFDKIKIVVGRNEVENQKIKTLASGGDVVIEMIDYPGPLTVIKNYSRKALNPDILTKAEELTRSYSAKARELTKDVKFNIIKHPKK